MAEVTNTILKEQAENLRFRARNKTDAAYGQLDEADLANRQAGHLFAEAESLRVAAERIEALL